MFLWVENLHAWHFFFSVKDLSCIFLGFKKNCMFFGQSSSEFFFVTSG